ncbi:MAG: DUF3592 domain-containing protein [Pseudomonadales bacterium]|nr:DUF3592 domain-containing protein [Pseudomonadales bacterium]
MGAPSLAYDYFVRDYTGRTIGTIESSKTGVRYQSGYKIEIHDLSYSYAVDGQLYFSTRSDHSFDSENLEIKLSRYHEGMKVDVYYMEANPTIAMLEPDELSSGVWITLVGLVLFSSILSQAFKSTFEMEVKIIGSILMFSIALLLTTKLLEGFIQDAALIVLVGGIIYGARWYSKTTVEEVDTLIRDAELVLDKERRNTLKDK